LILLDIRWSLPSTPIGGGYDNVCALTFAIKYWAAGPATALLGRSALTGGYINDRREPQGWRAHEALVPFQLDAPNLSGASHANGRDSAQGQSRHK
jgi:hypothetical protein